MAQVHLLLLTLGVTGIPRSTASSAPLRPASKSRATVVRNAKPIVIPPHDLGNSNPRLLGQQPLIFRPALLGERNDLGTVFKVECVEVIPLAAPDEGCALENIHDFEREAVLPRDPPALRP